MSAGPLKSSTSSSSEDLSRQIVEHSSDSSPPHLTPEEREAARKLVWRAPALMDPAPGSQKVLPQFTAPGIRIECVSRRPINTLGLRVEDCRQRQAEQGRTLASTFCHSGNLFLVFKRWPNSASPFPRST